MRNKLLGVSKLHVTDDDSTRSLPNEFQAGTKAFRSSAHHTFCEFFFPLKTLKIRILLALKDVIISLLSKDIGNDD